MAGLEVTVIGAKKIAAQLRKMGADYDLAVKRVINSGALAIHADAVISVQRGPKTGIVYEKWDPRRTHQASKADEAPATDTGNLVRQITIVTDEDGKGARIVSKAEYSWFLEFGTTNMAARPFMNPALNKNVPQILRNLQAAWRGDKA